MPAKEGRAPGQAGAEGDDQDEVAVLDLAVFPGFFKRERDGGRRGVAVAAQVGGEALHADVELAGDGLEDTDVGLVRDEPGDFRRGHAALREHPFAGLGHHADGVAEDFLAVHAEVMAALAKGVGGGGSGGAAGRAMQEFGVVAVGAEQVAEQADVLFRGGLEEGRAGAVTEEDAGGAVGPIHDAGEFLGSDDEGATVGAGAHHVLGDLEGVDEAGAGGGDVEAGDVTAQAELGLQEARRGREGDVRRHRRDDEEVDVGGRQAGALQGLGGGLGAEVRRILARAGDPAFADAGAGLDPLVGGIHHLGELGVGERAFRRPDPDGPNKD